MAEDENRTPGAALPEASQDAALLTYDDLRRRLGLPSGTLYALVHEGRIPHVRIGKRLVRFRAADIECWLASRTVLPTEVK